MSKQKIFIFDFDGVICDSTNECLINSLNSYYIYLKKKTKIQSINNINIKLRNDFKSIRPYIKGAKEYLKFYDYYFNNKNINVNSFINYKNNNLKYDVYLKIFYSERENLKKIDLKKWISLNFVFKDIIKLLNSLDFYYIATLKDKKSVIDILSHSNINIFEEKIFDFSMINSKLEALQLICKKNGYKKNKLIFIDDNAYHLIDPKKNGYNVFLSSWADLNNDKHIEIALENKIDIIKDINKIHEKNSRYTS